MRTPFTIWSLCSLFSIAVFTHLTLEVDEKNKNNASGALQKNRGFCFLEYDTHQAASQARRRLLSGKLNLTLNRSTIKL